MGHRGIVVGPAPALGILGEMVVEAKRLPFESLARVAERLARGISLAEALELLAAAAEEVTGADLAVVRVLDDEEDMLVARAVAPAGSVLAAEVSGSRVEPDYEVASQRLLVPARVGGISRRGNRAHPRRGRVRPVRIRSRRVDRSAARTRLDTAAGEPRRRRG